MTLNGFWPVFACGVFGGLLGELLKWYRLREQEALPYYAKSAFYWSITCLTVLAGGGIAVLYGTKDVNALMALMLVLTAPLIIQSGLNGDFDQQADNAGGDDISERHNIAEAVRLYGMLPAGRLAFLCPGRNRKRNVASPLLFPRILGTPCLIGASC